MNQPQKSGNTRPYLVLTVMPPLLLPGNYGKAQDAIGGLRLDYQPWINPVGIGDRPAWSRLMQSGPTLRRH